MQKVDLDATNWKVISDGSRDRIAIAPGITLTSRSEAESPPDAVTTTNAADKWIPLFAGAPIRAKSQSGTVQISIY